MRSSRPFLFRSLSVLLVTLTASIAFAQDKDESKTPVLTRAQFDQLLSRPDRLLLIDLRRPDGKAGDLLAAKGFEVVGRIGVQNYEQDGGKLTKIAPKASPQRQKNAQATVPY